MFATNVSAKKRIDVAIVGLPNAGKSQLLNVMIQSPVAAVSRKRHTTRDGILGARTIDNTQILFVDTPGYLRPRTARQEGLLRDLTATATSELQTADYTLLVVDAARKLTDDLKEALLSLMLYAIHSKGRFDDAVTMEGDDKNDSDSFQEERKEKFAIVLNKVDLVHPKDKLLDIAETVGIMAEECIKYRGQTGEENDGHNMHTQDVEVQPPAMDEEALEEMYPPIFYVSALKDDGVDDIVQHLLSQATPCQSWVVPPGDVTHMTSVERVEEILREKLYRCLHREVPHHVHQVNRIFRTLTLEDGTKVIRIDQDLVVQTKSHKRLVMGTGGRTLQRIHEMAQKDLQRIFKCKVSLRLHVKQTKSKHRRPLESGYHGHFSATHPFRVD